MVDSSPPPDFDALVDTHYQGLYRFAFSLAKNESDASDLTQQTFLIWARKGQSLRDPEKAKSWLFTTLYREFLRLRRRNRHQADLTPEAFEAELPSVNPDMLRTLDARGAVDALDQVDEIYRRPLLLFYLDGQSYKSIASTLDVPIGTIMSRLSRGKSQLKQILLKKLK